jgi:hypothetical protein
MFNKISKYEAEVDDSVVSLNFKFTGVQVYGINIRMELLVVDR